MVQITGFDVKHNHNVSKAVYENYVSNRRVEDPSILAFADELRAAGSKPKLVMQYLRKKTGGFGWIMGVFIGWRLILVALLCNAKM